MHESPITADYVIKGAGAIGMAFADSIFTETDATMVIVDRHDRPGGHWNDAYPFVRLHQPSSSYGVNSAPLGTGATDTIGLNAGYEELASGQEVLSHFDLVMSQTFLPSGRVHYFPMSEIDDEGVVTSLLSGERFHVEAGRFVDGTHSAMSVPSTTAPTYTVSPEMTCVAVNELSRRAPTFDEFVVIGAGKTGMDACIWLLNNGADPSQVKWIVPRDSWVLNRGNVQFGEAHFARLCKSIADQAEAAALSDSIDEVFSRLEGAGEISRLDPNVEPGAYHCAILSDAEMTQLRSVGEIVRLGRVVAIHADRMELKRGEIPTSQNVLHVDCSAAGIPSHPETTIFDGDRITLQWVRTCQPTFSAALIGFVESAFDDDETKNRLCAPIMPPTVPFDMLRVLRVNLANRSAWNNYPNIGDWMTRSRLEGFSKLAQTQLAVDPKAAEHLERYLSHVASAMANLDKLLAKSDGGVPQ